MKTCFIFALGALVAFAGPAGAATARRSPAHRHIILAPDKGARAPSATSRFAVPGWSDEDTRRWLNGAGSLWRGA
jgi:hypothetical protein